MGSEENAEKPAAAPVKAPKAKTAKKPKRKAKAKSLPTPKPGKTYTLFRPANSHSFHASILMPNGYTEDFHTHESDKNKATIRSTTRVRMLYRELEIESPADKRRKTGELSKYKIYSRRARGLPVPGDEEPEEDNESNGVPLPPGPRPLPVSRQAEGAAGWGTFVMTVEQRYMMAFRKIEEMLLLGVADDPVAFVAHIRALVVQALHGAGSLKARRMLRDD